MPGKPRGNPRTAKKNTITARGMKLTKLDADAQPVGDPVELAPGEYSLDIDLGAFTPDDSDIALPLPPLAPDATLEFTTDDPAAVELARKLLRIPVPTAVIASWFPAMFRRPVGAHEDEVWTLCKVFLTPQGLYVYREPPAEPETFTSGAQPAWYSVVDFEKTTRPVAGYAARSAGIPIITAAGSVLVQPTGGCGCSATRLRHWRPPWSRNLISWEDGVTLATAATEGR